MNIDNLQNYKCIAIAGNNGVGKTTFANVLCDVYGLKHEQRSFAGKLRKIVGTILDIPEDDLKKSDIKESFTEKFPNHTARDVLINIATAIRSIKNDYFVEETFSCSNATGIIIDDIRFAVEAESIQKKYASVDYGCIFVLLKLPNEDYTGDLPMELFDVIITRRGDDYYCQRSPSLCLASTSSPTFVPSPVGRDVAA